jgi:hypothetical protein
MMALRWCWHGRHGSTRAECVVSRSQLAPLVPGLFVAVQRSAYGLSTVVLGLGAAARFPEPNGVRLRFVAADDARRVLVFCSGYRCGIPASAGARGALEQTTRRITSGCSSHAGSVEVPAPVGGSVLTEVPAPGWACS